MPFIAPLALAGLAFVPLVVAFYLLKLRRDERPVASTLLWQRLVADVEANAPWQRLRRSLLLLLQLLLVLVLVFLAARPFIERPAGLARDLVLVIDASASMGATDVAPDRLSVAKARAIDALRDLPAGGRVSVIAAGRTARVVANGTSDLARVRAAIGSIVAEPAPGDMADALTLADALAARAGDAQVLVVTDAAFSRPPSVRVDAPVGAIVVGRERRNQAIVALAVRTAPSAVTRSVFVSVANLDIEKAERRIELYGDGRLLEARDVYLDPLARADVNVDDVPRDVAVVEVRLVSADENATGGPPDELAVDDRAWAIVPPDEVRRILLISPGDPYLQAALTYLPNTELYGVKPTDVLPSTFVDKRDGSQLFDLIIVEGGVPASLPPVPVLAIAPTATSPLAEVTGTLTSPGIAPIDQAEPVLRYVDLSTTHIAEAQKLVLPDWARPIIRGPGDAPLLYAGVRAGIRTAVLAFDPRRSDLPLQVGFPILLSNLVGELLGGSSAPAGAVSPGSPVQLSIPSGASGLKVTRPDGTSVDLAAGTPGAVSLTFTATQSLGVYTVTPLGLAPASGGSPAASGASAGPAASAEASAAPSRVPTGGSPTPAGSGAASPGGTRRAADPGAPVRFAVNLFDVGESTIAPGSAAGLEALGSGGPRASGSGGPRASGGPSAGGAASSPEGSATGWPWRSPAGSPAASAATTPTTGSGTSAGTRPPARDELWTIVLVIALVLLLVEYGVYQRDAVARGRRALAARLGRPSLGARLGRPSLGARLGRRQAPGAPGQPRREER
jgi:Ca-activated chloride channel family protein